MYSCQISISKHSSVSKSNEEVLKAIYLHILVVEVNTSD